MAGHPYEPEPGKAHNDYLRRKWEESEQKKEEALEAEAGISAEPDVAPEAPQPVGAPEYQQPHNYSEIAWEFEFFGNFSFC